MLNNIQVIEKPDNKYLDSDTWSSEHAAPACEAIKANGGTAMQHIIFT